MPEVAEDPDVFEQAKVFIYYDSPYLLWSYFFEASTRLSPNSENWVSYLVHWGQRFVYGQSEIPRMSRGKYFFSDFEKELQANKIQHDEAVIHGSVENKLKQWRYLMYKLRFVNLLLSNYVVNRNPM